MADQNKAESVRTSIETIINVNEICRFCLSKTKSNISINDKCFVGELREFEEDSIYNFVTRLKFIKMEDNRDFPTRVCQNCYSLINMCNEFKQLCQKSDALLRNYYENNLKETKNPIQNDKTEVKTLLEIPSNNKPENKPNYNTQFLTSKKLNVISNKIIKVNKLGLNIVDVYKQKLHLLSEKVKEAHTKLTQGLVINNKQYACSRCSLKFSTAQGLNIHNIITHNQKRFRFLLKFQCENCQKSFSDQTKLERHYKIIHKISRSELHEECSNKRLKGLIHVEKFVCCHCNPNMEFKCREELIEHLRLHKSSIPCKQVNENETVEDLKQLICKRDEDSVTEKSNLTDLSAFINILDSVVDSLTIAQQDKESGFKLLCKNCNPPLEFTSTSDFINHISAHHYGLKLLENWVIESKAKKDGNWSCAKCPATYTRKQLFYCHMNEKHNQMILNGMKCPEPGCCASFNTNRQLIQHGIVVHEKYFAYFHKVFKKVLQSANKEDNREKNFECDICKKKYIYKTSLRKHIFGSHLGKSVKNPVVCSYCGKTVSSKLNLKSHIEFMHEALYVSCPICKKKINFRTIGKHYKTHKTNSEVVYSKNSFLCNLCGKILKSKRSFEDHQKLHKNIRDELCDVCGRGFTTKKFLRLHKKTHEGVQRKIFPCDQCDKVFSGRQTLNRHLLTHSGKKNFICEICSKCFYTLQELNRHVRYHKKEYRFDCQLCDMRFLDKSRFRHHMMKHRNVRPHKCQFCEKMFIVRGKMNLHMAAKHNVEVENRKGVWKDPKTYVPLDDLL